MSHTAPRCISPLVAFGLIAGPIVIAAIALAITGWSWTVIIAAMATVALTAIVLLGLQRRCSVAAIEHSAREQHMRDELHLLQARQSEQRIIQQSMSTGMIALDDEQRVLSINRAAEQLLGVRESSATGKPLRESLHEPELNRFIHQALVAANQSSAEFQLLGRGGATVHAMGEPLRNGESKPVGLLVLLSDVTRMKKLEAMRSDFAANVSHELRTPITNIMGYVETLRDVGMEDREQSRKFLDIVHRNTERLAFIVEDLLSLARLERPEARDNLARELTPVRQIIEATIAQFESARAEKNIRIEIEAMPSLQAMVDSQLIEQALGNLLSNAIKYSPANTTVKIRARLVSGEIELAVIDQGPGIAREHLPRLFERFYRVDRARSREMGGTGLGLAIVKHIALVHGGRVEVESEQGKGSTFRIMLPMQDE